MNVIRKKSQSGRDANANASDAFAPWVEMHTSLCDYFSKSVGSEILPGENSIDTGAFKGLCNDMTETLISFGFGNSSCPNMCIAAFEPYVAKILTDRKLGVSGNNGSSIQPDIEVGLLDLFLMGPGANQILDGLNSRIQSLAEHDQDLQKTSQKIGLSKFEVDKSTGDWVKLTLRLDVVDEKPTESKKVKPAKTNKKAPKGDKEESTKKAIYIFLPKNLLETISTDFNSSLQTPDFDPTEPWAIHMREAIGNADVCIKAVLETCDMSVAECTRLSIGQVITLPGVALHSIGLETETEGGTVELAVSALGTYKANRAVQLTDDILAQFVSDLDTITI